MRESLSIDQPKQLLVEGQDDLRIFCELAKRMDISDIQINSYGGYPKLRPYLKTFVALPGFQSVSSLAVVTDANSNRTDREKGIRDALYSALNLTAPSSPLEMKSHGCLSLVYLVVPPDSETGMMEDVCLASISTDPAIDCVDAYFECVRSTSLPGPNETQTSKARVHAFLASREHPGLRLGEAAESGIWQLDAEAFSPLKELLSKL